MKHVTTFEQSRMLADILSKESADMCYLNDGTAIKIDAISYSEAVEVWKEWYTDIIPCWSLGALLSLIPYPMLGQATNEPNKGKWYVHALVNPDGDFTDYVTDVYDTPIEACIDAITELHSTTKGGEE